MSEINLREYYPDYYKEDYFVTVPDEVAEILKETKRKEESDQRKKYRYGAQYSLDRGDGIEKKAVLRVATPPEIYELGKRNKALYTAIAKLPNKQAKRIYAHFILGMSVSSIAKSEKVGESRVYESIRKGIRNLAKLLEKNI